MDVDSQDAIIESLDTLKNADSYYRWLSSHVKPFLGGKVLEIGAGIGNFARWGREFAAEYHVSEVDPRLVEILGREFHTAFQWDIFQPFSREDRYDAVVILNVVEHLEDDYEAVRSIHRLLVPGGHLVLMVPAMPWLFGSLDEAFGHYRRYTNQSIKRVIEGAGFRVLRTQYINTIGMLGWYVYGKVLKRKQLPDAGCKGFNFLVPLLKLERPIAKLAGLSSLAIARK